ncbi:hypothetical protein AB1Y20_017361 [Prymnesium parvum]|uniref:Uncharacterized protein n=1 Tax=Prymnesium parvum TaxID=97485 RepID=A0AB34JMX7_PRYPA
MAALSSAPRCPAAAEVAATPLMPYPSQPSAGKRRCYGLPAHPPLRPTARRRIGVLITVTAEKMNAVPCLHTLLQTDPALHPHHVLVTVDFTNKSRAADAAARRRAWAAEHTRDLHAAADALHAMARAPVLLELVELGSCMAEYLMRHVF